MDMNAKEFAKANAKVEKNELDKCAHTQAHTAHTHKHTLEYMLSMYLSEHMSSRRCESYQQQEQELLLPLISFSGSPLRCLLCHASCLCAPLGFSSVHV